MSQIEESMMQQDDLVLASKGRVLTDDKAPVELLSMRAIDQIIQTELVYYKEIFRHDGIKGILQAI